MRFFASTRVRCEPDRLVEDEPLVLTVPVVNGYAFLSLVPEPVKVEVPTNRPELGNDGLVTVSVNLFEIRQPGIRIKIEGNIIAFDAFGVGPSPIEVPFRFEERCVVSRNEVILVNP